MMAMISIILTAAFAVAMNLPDRISFHIFLMLTIGTGALFLVPILYLDHLETKQYPQWKNIWKTPQGVVVFLIVLIVIMVAAAFLTDCNLSWVIIVILFLRPCFDYYWSMFRNIKAFAGWRNQIHFKVQQQSEYHLCYSVVSHPNYIRFDRLFRQRHCIW